MPKPTEICEVTAFGATYNNWKTVEVTRMINDYMFIHAMLSAAEVSSPTASKLSDIKLKPDDPVTIKLAGQLAVNGWVYLRQAAADATQHAIQIGVSSTTSALAVSTVDVKPGQYINQTVDQIANAIGSTVGVKFHIEGDAPGALMPFPRFSEHMGETRLQAITRACNMRNLHLVDDNGTLVAFRKPFGNSGFTIKQGYNMERGRIMLQTWDQVDPLQVNGQDHNNDSADANRQTQGVARIPGKNRPVKYAAEETGTDAVMQMAAHQERDFVLMRMVDGDITVPGWLAPDGQLWLWHVGEKIDVYAPLLLPSNSMTFMIKGVVHRQADGGGTTTDILLTDALGVGAGAEAIVSGLSPGAEPNTDILYDMPSDI